MCGYLIKETKAFTEEHEPNTYEQYLCSAESPVSIAVSKLFVFQLIWPRHAIVLEPVLVFGREYVACLKRARNLCEITL